MYRIILLSLLIGTQCFAGGRKAPVIVEEPEMFDCVNVPPREKSLVYLGAGSSDVFKSGGKLHDYMEQAYCYLNTVYANGCLERKVVAHNFLTLERVVDPQLKVSETRKAWADITANAPYAIDHRYYWKRFTKVVGYTFNWIAGMPELGSETHVWTNFRMIGDPPEMAAHTGHEFTHQGRAKGFGHWSRFSGSMPYDFGDLIAECIKETFHVELDMSRAVDFSH